MGLQLSAILTQTVGRFDMWGPLKKVIEAKDKDEDESDDDF